MKLEIRTCFAFGEETGEYRLVDMASGHPDELARDSYYSQLAWLKACLEQLTEDQINVARTKVVRDYDGRMSA